MNCHIEIADVLESNSNGDVSSVPSTKIQTVNDMGDDHPPSIDQSVKDRNPSLIRIIQGGIFLLVCLEHVLV